MANYYNEIDPYAAQWLRNLITAGHIPRGIVDERSIVDVKASELEGFTQCHFFAGIGGWNYALRLAGWPDDRPVWTGSPPCQPFSCAGKQLAQDDARHLAPHWVELVTECRPPIVFGEQVSAAIGRGWFDDLQIHLEAESYACGMVVLPACSVGAPHLRQRQWIVAERLGVPDTSRLQTREREAVQGAGRRQKGGTAVQSGRTPGGLADAEGERFRETGDSGSRSEKRAASIFNDDGLRPTNGFWRAADWLHCRDEKWRPVEPGAFPLANGVPARVGKLRAYGNAIIPQVAAEVIGAYLDGTGKGQ